MALSEQSRNEIFTYLSTTNLGTEAISEMLSYFPARDVEEPVTKEFLRSELALVRLELHEELATLRADVTGEMNTLRADVTNEMNTLRADMTSEINTLRADMTGEMNTLRADVTGEMRRQFFWLMSTILAVLGVMVTLIIALR